MRKLIVAALAAIALVGCATQNGALKSDTYSKLYEEKPVTILVMPPINKSTKVEAKELFYCSLTVPITQKGYYVLPELLTMQILKEESAYDSEMFENSSMKPISQLFGVDAVLFTTIHEWSKTAIASQIRVKIQYVLKSAKTDEVLFDRTGTVTFVVQNSGGGLAGLAASMIQTALTKEIVVGRKCNEFTLSALPCGRYNPLFENDGNTLSGEKEFSTTLNY